MDSIISPQAPVPVQNVPAPMQPAPWHSDVVNNFQEAHGALTPVAQGYANGTLVQPYVQGGFVSGSVTPNQMPPVAPSYAVYGNMTGGSGGSSYVPGQETPSTTDQGPQQQDGPPAPNSQGPWQDASGPQVTEWNGGGPIGNNPMSPGSMQEIPNASGNPFSGLPPLTNLGNEAPPVVNDPSTPLSAGPMGIYGGGPGGIESNPGAGWPAPGQGGLLGPTSEWANTPEVTIHGGLDPYAAMYQDLGIPSDAGMPTGDGGGGG